MPEPDSNGDQEGEGPQRVGAGAGAAPSPSFDQRWQERTLPLMVRTVVGLTVFFFVVSLVQLTYLHWTIRQAPEFELPSFAGVPEGGREGFEDRFSVARFRTLAELDARTTERRYHQVNALLMARVWTRYMGFVTGMILATVGAVFILGKLRESSSEMSASVGDVGMAIRSASPGLIMTVLGVFLMVITIVVNHRIEGTDVPGYVRYFGDGALPPEGSRPPLQAPAEIPR